MDETKDFNLKEVAKTQTELFKGLLQYELELRTRLSEVDREICDLEHFMEFSSLNAAKGFQAYQMLKERLIKRRKIKNQMAMLNCLLNCTSGDFSTGKAEKQIDLLAGRTYRPRVLFDLFDANAET